jgi:hypothetical protein
MVVMLNFKKMAKEISKVVKLQVREVLQSIATGWTCFRAAGKYHGVL